MKKTIPLLVLFLIILSLITPTFIFAQEPLVPCGIDIASLKSGGCNFCDLIELIRRVVRFIVFLAAPVVTILIAWAGIRLIISGESEDARKNAKQLLKDALIGFLWILLAGTLVNLILVTLVDSRVLGKSPGWWWGGSLNCPTTISSFDTTMTPSQIGVVPGQSGSGMTSEQKREAETALRAELSAAGISINRSNWCTFSGQSECTDVSGLNSSTLEYAKTTKIACGGNCQIVITGGSETGVHSGEGAGTHAGGDKIDIRPNPTLDAYITRNFQYAGTRIGAGAGEKYIDPKTGSLWVREGDHWDVQVMKSI